MSVNSTPSPLSDLGGGDVSYEHAYAYVDDNNLQKHVEAEERLVQPDGSVFVKIKSSGINGNGNMVKKHAKEAKPTAAATNRPTQPIANGAHDTLTKGKWDTTLFSCFDFCVPNCFMATFCPYITAAQVASRVGFQYQNALIVFFVLVALECVCYGLMFGTLNSTEEDTAYDYDYDYFTDSYYTYSYTYYTTSTRLSVWAYIAYLISILIFVAFWQLRTKVRATFQLPGSCVEDFFVSFCCSCCSLAQMATHVKSYKPNTCDFGAPDELPAYAV